jgi:GH3 auxin-responsive promoter
MPSALFRAGMLGYRALYWSPLQRLAADPDRAQAGALARILRQNRSSEFGLQHRFAAVSSPDEFRERVALHDYEKLRGYIERQRRTGAPSLTAESPLFYAQTSGSTGHPKHIPVTRSALRLHRAEQALFTYLQYRACPGAFSGRALGIMGAAVEGNLDSGHAVGSVSGHLYESLPRSVQARFVVPPQVSTIADYDLKYLVILRLALGAANITYLGSPNPSTFLRLLEILNARRDALARSLETGRLPELDAVAPSVRDVVQKRLRPDRTRALELLGSSSGGALTYASLWPGIQLLTTWTGGSCGIALDKLRTTMPTGTKVMELGYQSTECRGTVAVDPETPAGLPMLHHHYFEFVDQADWDSGRPRVVGLGQLAAGTRYYVVVTTASGLFRYFMNDLVEVGGRFAGTPLLRFVQKGKGVTSLTGEKLYEAHVIEAVQQTSRRFGINAGFFVLVANEESSSYQLYIESDAPDRVSSERIAEAVDALLAELNQEYQAKRKSGRLSPLTVAWMRLGAGEEYKAACVRKGQREGQFKPAVLQYKRDMPLSFDPYVCA